jgi:Lon protease-like protein
MDYDLDMPPFSGQCLLFPLPDVVLFPYARLPLHIFEPRYRQMTTDALAGDRLVTIVPIRPAPRGSPWVEPVPIMDIGCLGQIVEYLQLPDGRFNIVLIGWKRVRLLRETPSAKLYRIAQAEIIEDQESVKPLEQERAEINRLYRAILEKRQTLDENLVRFLDLSLPLGVLTDIIAQVLPLPIEVKQSLLSEPAVERRCETLKVVLRQISEHDEPKPGFPPRFSLN